MLKYKALFRHFPHLRNSYSSPNALFNILVRWRTAIAETPIAISYKITNGIAIKTCEIGSGGVKNAAKTKHKMMACFL